MLSFLGQAEVDLTLSTHRCNHPEIRCQNKNNMQTLKPMSSILKYDSFSMNFLGIALKWHALHTYAITVF